LRGPFSAVSTLNFTGKYVVHTRLKALDEIYKIYTLLHRWNPIEKPWKALLASVAPHSKIRLKLIKHSSIFAVLFSKLFCCFLQYGPNLTNFDAFSEFQTFHYLYGKDQNILTYTLKFPGISQRIFLKLIFQKMIFENDFEKLEKRFLK